MNSTDGITKTSPIGAESQPNFASTKDLKNFPKTAEDFVAIQNKLAAHHEKPVATPQLNSIFDTLRSQLPPR